jgi:hypothetical protein
MRRSHRFSWLSAVVLMLPLTACSGGGGGTGGDGGNDDAGNGSADGGDGGENTSNNNGSTNNNNEGSTGDNAGSTGDGGDSTGASTGDSTGASTGDSTGASTGDSTGASTGDSTGGGNAGFSCAGAGTLITATGGGSVASDDSGAFVLSFAAGALTADTTVKVCVVPVAKIPNAVTADATGPVTSVYRIEPATLPLAASASASSALTLSSTVQQAITNADGVAPLMLRGAADTGGPSTLTGTEMRGAFPGSASLHGVHTVGGYVYARHLDVAGIRHRVKVVPAASANALTGVPIQVGLRVAAEGAPTTALDLALRTVGCDLEPIALSGTEQAHTRDEAFGCEAEPIDWPAATVVAGGGSLGAGAVVDLTVGGSDVDATHTPPTFVCTHSGTARAQVQLRFLPPAGTTPLTTLVGTQDFACTWTGDRIIAANYATATRVAHGPIVPTVAPFGAPLPVHDVAFVTDAYRQAVVALGADGFYYKGVSATRSEQTVSTIKLLAPNNDATLVSGDRYEAVTYTESSIDNKEPTDPNTANINVQYFTPGGGALRVEAATSAGAVVVAAAGSGELDVKFGTPNGVDTSISFADGAADTIYIRGVIRSPNGATGAIQPDGFVRWLRASDLPLVVGRRSFTVLTTAQAMALTTAAVAPTHFQIGFLKTNWDEARTFWPTNGRVVPVSGGVVYQLSASRLAAAPVASPCPTTVQTGTNSACKSGPNEVLAVAVGADVELFSALDGSYLRNLAHAEAGEPNGFIQIVQNTVDHCLYATQQTTSLGSGIWRYGSDGELLSGAAVYLSDAGLTPAGLLAQGPLLLVANEQGGVDVINTTAAPSIVATYDATALARGVTTNTNGDLYLSDVATGAADGSIRSVPAGSPNGTAATVFVDPFTDPRQVALDFANTPNLLVAIAGDNAVAAYAFSDGGVVRNVDDLYQGTESPVGIWPLFNEHWLVAGDNIGVDVVMPGSHVRTNTKTTISADAGQVSRLCLP